MPLKRKVNPHQIIIIKKTVGSKTRFEYEVYLDYKPLGYTEIDLKLIPGLDDIEEKITESIQPLVDKGIISDDGEDEIDENPTYEHVLMDEIGTTTFFINSEELHQLSMKELNSKQVLEFSNQSIKTHITYYWLQSICNQVKLDDLYVSSTLLFGVDNSIDCLSFISLERLSKFISPGQIKILKKFLSNYGLNIIEAKIKPVNWKEKIRSNPEKYLDYLNKLESNNAIKDDAEDDFYSRFVDPELAPDLVIDNEDEVVDGLPENIILDIFERCKPYEKSIILLIRNESFSFLLGLLFVYEILDINQVIAIQQEISKLLEINKYYMQWSAIAEHKIFKNQLLKAQKFLEIYRKEELELIIAKGETKYVEFKSTLRYDLNAKQILKDREKDVLRTIAGFLNSEGGTLFIGVTDEGNILGLEFDNFKNTDKYLLHLQNLINNKLIPTPARQVNTEIVKIGGKLVCIVKCGITDQPIFLKWDNQEEFYIRTGPSTIKLGLSETLNYVKENYHDYSSKN